jgi:tetratricopeptide (TPR) repeat protein
MASETGKTPGNEAESQRLPIWLRWLLPLALFAVTLLPSWPAVGYGFVDYDDDRNFYPQYNPWFNAQTYALEGPTLEWMLEASHYGHYQPLTWISYGLDAAFLGGFDPGVFHRTNLLLHALNAVLVYWLAWLLLGAAGRGRAGPLALALAAAATSLLYALHPLRVESVAWITERRDVLSGALLLLAVIAYVRYAGGARGGLAWMALSLGCYALSLGAKAWGITLPAVLLVLDLYPLRRREGVAAASWKRLLGEKLGYVPLALVFARLAASAQAEILATVSLAEHGPLQRLAQACYGLLFYPLKTLWPAGLSPLYLLEADLDPTRPVYLAAMALVAGVMTVLVVLRRRVPGLVAAAVAYAILVSPVLGFLQSGAQKVADRYTYLAALPLTLLAGWLVLRLAEPANALRRGLVLVGVLVLGLALGVTSRAQTRYWSDTEALYRRMVDVESDNYFALHSLAVTLQQRGAEHLAEALGYARASVEAHPGRGNVEARRNVAWILRRMGREADAEASLREALEVAPDWLPTLQDLVRALQRRGDTDGAVAAVEHALDLAPDFLEGYAELAALQAARGRGDLALQAWRRGLEVDPGWPQGNHALGRHALQTGDPVEAEARFLQALRRGVPSADMLVDLGRALQAQGRAQDAAVRYQQALSMDPAHAQAQALLRGLGR